VKNLGNTVMNFHVPYNAWNFWPAQQKLACQVLFLPLFLGTLFKNAVNCYDYTVLVTDKLMYIEHWWKDTDRGKLKYLKKLLSQ